MGHEISSASGRAEIAYAGETPWHGLGTKVEGLQTVADMLSHAGLGWTVGLRPLLVDLGDSNTQQIDTHRAVYREDVGATLGVVTSRYQPVQNAQCGEIVDALVAEGGAHVEVAGALGQGERCWMLARLPDAFEVVKGDEVRPYFLLAWGHDGKHGIAGKLTPIRVVCANTLAAAGLGKGVKWSEAAPVYIRHYGDPKLRIDEAREALGLARKQVAETRDVYQALVKPVTAEQVAGYYRTVFPDPEMPEQFSGADERERYDAALAAWVERRDTLLYLFRAGTGVEVPGVGGTAWAAYNAVTEYADHYYPVLRSGQVSPARQQSALFGAFGDLKARALEHALTMVS